MTIVQQNVRIELVRPSLDDLPVIPLPRGYATTWYATGDERHWVDIHAQADPYYKENPERFVHEFGRDPKRLAERQLYLRTADGTVIGTASAWYDGPDPNTPVGRVHWVALLPAYQGRGLAKPLLAQVCHRLRELGHRSAMLATSTGRVPAVNLYLRFGFTPSLKTPADRAVWRELASFLKQRVAIPEDG